MKGQVKDRTIDKQGFSSPPLDNIQYTGYRGLNISDQQLTGISIGTLKHETFSRRWIRIMVLNLVSFLIYPSLHRFSITTEQNKYNIMHCTSQYILVLLVPLDRIELPIDDYKSTVIPFN